MRQPRPTERPKPPAFPLSGERLHPRRPPRQQPQETPQCRLLPRRLPTLRLEQRPLPQNPPPLSRLKSRLWLRRPSKPKRRERL